MLTHKSSEMLISLENTYMLISRQRSTSKTLFSPKKQLNVDFTRTHEHRGAHLFMTERNVDFTRLQRLGFCALVP